MTNAKVTEFVKDLRDMADWFEKYGEDLPPFIFEPEINLQSYVSLKEDLVTALSALKGGTTPNNPVVKEQTNFAYELHRKFGKTVKFVVWASRDTVCERVQVGTKVEPVTQYVETGETKEVPVYEWNCTESLLK